MRLLHTRFPFIRHRREAIIQAQNLYCQPIHHLYFMRQLKAQPVRGELLIPHRNAWRKIIHG